MKKKKGFSLVEMLAAAVLLAGAVVALCAVSTKGLAGLSKNRDYLMAWDIADRQLTLLEFMGIEQFLELRETTGKLGDGQNMPVYTWQIYLNEGDIEGLYFVNIYVSWGSVERPSTITLSTMLNYDSSATTTTTDTTVLEEQASAL